MKENYKITVIGDVHGRHMWHDIIEREKEVTTKFVFLGNYLDSTDVPMATQLGNFKQIIQFKRDNMDKVILLLGKHEYHYMVDEQYEGYNSYWASLLRANLKKGMEDDLFQMCYAYDGALFSNAGISLAWLANHATPYEMKNLPIDTLVNNIFYHKLDAFKFTGDDKEGESIVSSPIWIKPRSLAKVLVRNYAHVIGNTEQVKILKKQPGIVMVNTMGTSGEYLQIENGKSIIKQLHATYDDLPF